MQRGFLIQDPYDDDAIRLIRSLAMASGIRPICFYTDPKAKFYGQRQFPVLTTGAVAAEYDVFDGNLERLAAEVRRHHDVRAVIAYRDDLVDTAATLIDLLEIDWNDGATFGRFRDKHALKSFIAEHDPGVRLPFAVRITSVDDLRGVTLPERIVVKPNDGMGAVDVGFFDADDLDGIARHVAQSATSVWIVEEYIDGIEYRINGQVRHDGSVQTLLVGEYVPGTVTAHITFPYASESQVHRRDPRFDDLHGYASRLLAATGIRGVPFHMEVRVDAGGPAMTDLGARPPSESAGVLMSLLHPDRPNFYDVAARDYLGPNDFALGDIDYQHYDDGTYAIVYGLSSSSELISSLDGVDAVSSLPEFLFWSVEPRIGDHVRTTSDLRGVPFIANFRHTGGRERTLELADHVRATIRWNQSAGLTDRVRARSEHLLRRLRPKAAWTAASALRTIR